MILSSLVSRSRKVARVWLTLLVVAPVGVARADRISLRGGGEIRGKVVPIPDQKGKVHLFGFLGKTPLEFRQEQIVAIAPEPSALDEYVTLREQPRATAQAEFDLGTWCEAHKLPDLATSHFESAIQRDPAFGPAHSKLGHALLDGKWLDADGLREAQGLVKFQGKWMTVEDKEHREAQAASSNESRSWMRRISKMADAYQRGPEDRSRAAEYALMDIREPAAVGPVARVLGESADPAIRGLASRVLSTIEGPAASAALVNRVLLESDAATRQAAMTELGRREPSQVIPLIARGLKSSQIEIINRAAWALASLNAKSQVPRLVPALISVEYQVMMVPDPAGDAPPSGIFIGGGPSIPVQTPAIVGNGSVAFGASSIPLSALGGYGVNLGGGGGPRPPVPRVVPYERRNVEVLAALVKLTGQDFGYDMAGWQRWIASSFRIEAPGTGRRVPQP